MYILIYIKGSKYLQTAVCIYIYIYIYIYIDEFYAKKQTDKGLLNTAIVIEDLKLI